MRDADDVLKQRSDTVCPLRSRTLIFNYKLMQMPSMRRRVKNSMIIKPHDRPWLYVQTAVQR